MSANMASTTTKEESSEVKDILQCLYLPQDKLQEVMRSLMINMIQGLCEDTDQDQQQATMLPTFVRDVPDGSETGDFLALDLGGTNLRAYHIRVDGLDSVQVKNTMSYPISEKTAKGPGKELFNEIADFLAELLRTQNLTDQPLPLGFVFSFPCDQKDIDKCLLLQWSKGFTCEGVVGQDVVRLLKDAIKRKGEYNIDSFAVLNDTVATMLSCTNSTQTCQIAMIVGTGTNACYMEEMRNVSKMKEDEGRICINTEWGRFWNDVLHGIQTEFDKQLDQSSVNPGKHKFEKMISGMYLGELVQRLLIHLTQKELLFGGQTSDGLHVQDSFKTQFLSKIVEDGPDLEHTKTILESLGLPGRRGDCEIVQLVCKSVSTRSAQLCGAALAAIVNHMRESSKLEPFSAIVGADGSVYVKNPYFKEVLEETVRGLAPKCNFSFVTPENGNARGAAMVAAVAKRLASAPLP